MKDTANFIVNKVHELEYFNKFDEENKIMDFGCGTGWFSFSLIRNLVNF